MRIAINVKHFRIVAVNWNLGRRGHLRHDVLVYGDTVVGLSHLTGGTGTGVRKKGYRSNAFLSHPYGYGDTGVRNCRLTGGTGTVVGGGGTGVGIVEQVGISYHHVR